MRAAGAGVLVSARAPDGVVEAIELPDLPFALGVQWHPERLAGQASSAPCGAGWSTRHGTCAVSRAAASRGAPPRVLVAAGLDPSGGAGLAADVEALLAVGARALPVATALTVQGPAGAFRFEPVRPRLRWWSRSRRCCAAVARTRRR